MSSTSTTNYLSPVIFNARGSNIDVRLDVFNIMFHVHSSILKLNSPFFTFFDSADKLQSPAFTDGFKCEWVTKVVDGGTDWQLVCEGLNARHLLLFMHPCLQNDCRLENSTSRISREIHKSKHSAFQSFCLLFTARDIVSQAARNCLL
jgi:hypothetical protein